MIWSAKAKLSPLTLDPRILPWVLCAVVAAAVAVPGPKPADKSDSSKIAQLEQRIRSLEQKNVGSSYSILPSPAEELPSLDSREFYAKCEQWHVDPDRLKVLARKLADRQGITLNGDTPRPHRDEVVAQKEPAKPVFVTWRSQDVAMMIRPEPSVATPNLMQLVNGGTARLEMMPARPRPAKHRRHRRHRD